MPELPEVETLVRTLRPTLLDRTILSADLRWKRSLAEPAPAVFKRQIAGQVIRAVSRRGKFFHLLLTSCDLLIHLRMSGDLYTTPDAGKPTTHDRLRLRLSDENLLVFNDPRKFGRIWLLNDASPIFERLGPEPLSEAFTSAWFADALQRRRRQLKPLLLDQHFIAGLGNIYTDEALHRARLHPLIHSHTVNVRQAHSLWQAIRQTLQEGISRNGASIDWVYRGGEFQNQFRVYGRGGQPCPVCGTLIERIVTGQRGTHFCPNCQKIQ